MKKSWILIIGLGALNSCTNREMSLDELKEAKWDTLEPGVSFISRQDQKNIASKTDSLQCGLIGITGREMDATITQDSSFSEINKEMVTLLAKEANNSKMGYLRLNLAEMMMKDFAIKVYLGSYINDTDRHEIGKDSITLATMPGVKSVKWVSKEEAKKRYFEGESDTAWTSILSDNPLPSGFDVAIDGHNWTEKEIVDLKNSITENIFGVVDVSYRSFAFKYRDRFYYFRYERIKK